MLDVNSPGALPLGWFERASGAAYAVLEGRSEGKKSKAGRPTVFTAARQGEGLEMLVADIDGTKLDRLAGQNLSTL